MYAGVASPLVGQMFFRAINFMAYGQAVPFVKYVRGIDSMGPLDFFFAGALAQACGKHVL